MQQGQLWDQRLGHRDSPLCLLIPIMTSKSCKTTHAGFALFSLVAAGKPEPVKGADYLKLGTRTQMTPHVFGYSYTELVFRFVFPLTRSQSVQMY